jgi:hypothetical protein
MLIICLFNIVNMSALVDMTELLDMIQFASAELSTWSGKTEVADWCCGYGS